MIKNFILFTVENIIADIVDKSFVPHVLNSFSKEKILDKIKNKSECANHAIRNAGNILLSMIKPICNLEKVVILKNRFRKTLRKLDKKANHQVLLKKIKSRNFKLSSRSMNLNPCKILKVFKIK